MARRRSVPTQRSIEGSSTVRGDAELERVELLYRYLVDRRPRLASLAPLAPQDIERVALATTEVVWHFMTAPTPPLDVPLSQDTSATLIDAARNRSNDLYVTIVALVALKLAAAGRGKEYVSGHLEVIRDALDTLTFDFRASKRATVCLLRDLKSDLDARVAYIQAYRPNSYEFSERPELYANRRDKAERPDRFFRRVYADHVLRGLRQADIRRADPAFYNVLHVWCARHGKRLTSFVPATRTRRV